MEILLIFSAKNLFDNYLNPYNSGGIDYSLPDYHHSIWSTKDVKKPYVIIDTLTPITVTSVTFYRSGGERHVDPAIYQADVIAPRWPQQFSVYSAIRETGPWILQGSCNWSELGKPYPPEVFTNQAIQVTLPQGMTYKFWKLVVSGHQAPRRVAFPLTGGTFSEVSEAVFRGGRPSAFIVDGCLIDDFEVQPGLSPGNNFTPDN